MRKARSIAAFSVLLTLALLLSLLPLVSIEPVSASPAKMMWDIVDTPNADNTTNVIASPSEVNVIAIGSDGMTFYAVDIPGGNLHKSTDGGVTWSIELGGYLTAAGANLPVWNLAVAPDDLNFLVAVTDNNTGTPGGPRMVFVSNDGGASWENTNISLGGAEYISCIDISVTYSGNNRDIAVGTRTGGVGGGGVYAIVKRPGISAGWNNQSLPLSDVVALKFSPTYPSDSSLVVVSSDATATRLHLGSRDTSINTTSWNIVPGYPVVIRDTNFPPLINSPTAAQIVTADLDMPSDFSGQDISLRRMYVSTDTGAVAAQSGVYRIDTTGVNRINPPITGAARISSIAYWGTYDEGILLAGEVTAAELAPTPSSYGVYIWRTSNPNLTVGTPTWLGSDARRSPTGGAGGSGFANAQVAWSPDGERAYCGTSSANPTLGGTAVTVNQWPGAWLNSAPLDESAFSVSPYTPAYGQLLVAYDKTEDTTIGNIWNQLSLIDTEISLLSDMAALEAPEIGNEAYQDYDVLYLFSISDNATVPISFDSLWRSTSYPLGRTWERVLCISTSGTDTILRVKQTSYEDTIRSAAIVFADRGTDVIGYSGDEGQAWNVRPLTTVTDLALANDDTIYILNDTIVYRYAREGASWIQTDKVDTQLDAGHTIAVPQKNPEGEATRGWVIVGEAGLPNGYGRIAYADFSEDIVDFEPPISARVAPPVMGNAHVIADDLFDGNKTIYNAVHDVGGTSGKIYRWVIGSSVQWAELEPPNSAFYGLAQRNNVLYGVWNVATAIPPTPNPPGADRTLYPRANVPPPPEWDELTEGLPAPVVAFTREPSSLKISSNADNSLWAIDNNGYDWTNKVGCLWSYVDTVAKVGPWTTSPASGDFIPVDPVTGRALEVNFRWHQLQYASEYELQLAKDKDFSIVVLRNEHIVPVDQLSPEVYFPAGGLVPTGASASGVAFWGNLEVGHTYFWRVRARTTVTGETVRSPWSATMYFTVETGFPVMAPYPTLTLFSPFYGARGISRSPGFSWSPMPKTTGYEFILAKDAALQQVVVKTNVPLTSYNYDGELDYNTLYFWQVRAIEPIASDPSAIGSFTVLAEEKPVVTTTEKPAPIPSWAWWVIALYAVLVAAMIAFAMVKPSYIRAKVAPLTKLESFGDKPKAAPAINLEPVVDKPPSLIAKIWSDMIMRAKRLRFWKRPGDGSSLDKLE